MCCTFLVVSLFLLPNALIFFSFNHPMIIFFMSMFAFTVYFFPMKEYYALVCFMYFIFCHSKSKLVDLNTNE